jgi:hypothetical protein
MYYICCFIWFRKNRVFLTAEPYLKIRAKGAKGNILTKNKRVEEFSQGRNL